MAETIWLAEMVSATRARPALRRPGAEPERSRQRHRGERVVGVMDQVGEQRDAAARREHRRLRHRAVTRTTSLRSGWSVKTKGHRAVVQENPCRGRRPAARRDVIEASRSLSDAARALEIEALAGERFAAVGQTVLAALADSGLSGRRVANVVSWFSMAQLALGPWRNRGEVRPVELAHAMGVSRWTEWRTRLDPVRAGLVRDWTLPEPEARGYGRGAVRVLEFGFVCTREVTRRAVANREERASRAERRREERRKAKEADRAPTKAPPADSSSALTVESRRED